MLRIQREIAAGTLKTDTQGAAEVELILSDGSKYAQKGKLTFTDVQVDESTGSVRLRAEFANPDRLLLPGMFVRANLVEGLRPDGILVHMQSVMRVRAVILTFMLLTRTIKSSVAILLPLKRKALSGLLIPVSRRVTV